MQRESVTIGTSSLRRIAQLKRLNPNVKILDVRGNINTRLRKLDDPAMGYTGLILASAGLTRGGFGNRISCHLKNDWWHAVGQGALAIECRKNDQFTIDFLSPLIHLPTTYECLAERTFMMCLEGGCSVPIGVRCEWQNDTELTISGIVLSLDGQKQVSKSLCINLKGSTNVELCKLSSTFTAIEPPKTKWMMEGETLSMDKFVNSATLGYQLAEEFKLLGALDILSEIRK